MTRINESRIYKADYPNIYTKRTCLDNSELYITSKLDMLYEKTMINRNMFNSKRMLKKMIEGYNMDRMI